LGEPGTLHARAGRLQLRQMRGKTVVFHTAVAVVCARDVRFPQESLTPSRSSSATLTDAEIEAYSAGQEQAPMTAQAAPGGEGLGIALLDSDQTATTPLALVGLPLITQPACLRDAAGIALLQSSNQPAQ